MLTLIIILMKMILTLLFTADFCHGILNLESAKHLKELNEELIPVAWYPKRWWNFCVLEDERKRKK